MIDILLATHNGEKYLVEQLDSICNQTYIDFKVIISDDGSSDGTVEIINKYVQMDKRFHLIENKHNIGYIKNFEKLLKISDSDYFMFCDQDDIWNLDKVELSYNAIKDSKVDLVFTDLEVTNEKSDTLFSSFNEYNKINAKKGLDLDKLLVKNYASGCTIIGSARLARKVIPFIALDVEAYVYDWYVLILSTYFNGANYIDKTTIKYRQHDNNSIGIYKRNKKYNIRNIKKNRNEFLNSRVKFASLLVSKFDEGTKEYNTLMQFIEYFKSLQNTRTLNVSFKSFNKFFANENFISKVRYLIVFHFPLFILN